MLNFPGIVHNPTDALFTPYEGLNLSYQKRRRSEVFGWQLGRAREYNRVFSRPVVWLVVTVETVGQTNQPCVMTGSPPYLTIRSC